MKGCVLSLATVVLAGAIFSARQARHPTAAAIVQQSAEDSIKTQAYEACRVSLPDLRLRPGELVFRAPGRYQVIRRRQADQIACVTWQGKVQYVDTALIQPGNGVITP